MSEAKTPKQNEFIILRANGTTFDNIAKDLKVSKSQLIQWSKLFEDDIKALQFEAFIQIKEAYSYNQKAKYEMLLKQLDKVDNAILEADLSKATIRDLFTIKSNLSYQLENLEKSVRTDPHITATNELGYKEKLDFKLNEA